MFKLGLVLLMVLFQNITADVTDGTELVMSFLVHRHGDKTPVDSTLHFSNDPETLKELTEAYGYGQLNKMLQRARANVTLVFIPAGRQRAYELGKYIRTRYSELLAPKYNRSEVYIRSTDSTRTKMTILTALAAIYRPNGDGWSDDLDWEPVPYTTVPTKYDFNTAMVNCPTFVEGYSSLYFAPSPAMSKTYSNVFSVLSSQFGYDISQLPALVYPIYDVFTSQISLGIPLDPAVEEIWDDVVAAAGASIDLTFGTEEYIPLQAGVLLNEFYEYSAKAIAGEATQRLRIYSAHDFNVYSFEAVTQISNRQRVPKYTSAYSLEVRKVIATGQYVVLPVYLPEPGQKEIYLQVKGCELLCDYEQFVEITQGYSLDINSWRTKCGFTDDLVVDDSSLA